MPVLCKKRKTMFTLPDDLITEIASFLWTDCTIHANELSADIDFYITWRTLVPPIFIKCAVTDKLHCYDVANPMRAGHPYWPRQLLELTPHTVWSRNLYLLGSFICREKIRGVKTYKRCCMRWIRYCCENIDLWYYFDLNQKVLSKITLDHFHARAHYPFLRQALAQISSYKFASDDEGFWLFP